MNKKVIGIIGKSGTGKDTLLNAVITKYGDRVHKITPTTTRNMRAGEAEGGAYYFTTRAQFEKQERLHELINIGEYNGWLYGINKNEFVDDKVNIGVFSLEGFKRLSLETEQITPYFIWLYSTDKTRLIRQLEREKNPNIDEIIRRFKADENDFKDLDESPNQDFLVLYRNEDPFDLNYIVTEVGILLDKIERTN